MQYLFFAKSGSGKSALATALLVPFLRNDIEAHMDKNELLEFLRISPRDRLEMCKNRIAYLNSTREHKFPFPEHVVQSNEAIYCTQNGKFIQNYDMPGDKNGLYDEYYETYCPPPYSIIRWDEAQKEVGGRDSQNMSPRVSALCQTHRKWGLDILYFTQRSRILDLNVRDNAIIVEISKMEHKLDEYGFIVSTTWQLKVFYSLYDLERYSTVGKKTYLKTSYTFEGNIFEHYNSDEGEEHYIYLADKRGLNLRKRPIRDESSEDIEDYVKENPYTPAVGYGKLSKDDQKRLEKEKQKRDSQW